MAKRAGGLLSAIHSRSMEENGSEIPGDSPSLCPAPIHSLGAILEQFTLGVGDKCSILQEAPM